MYKFYAFNVHTQVNKHFILLGIFLFFTIYACILKKNLCSPAKCKCFHNFDFRALLFKKSKL